jgi:hypothetical protein
MAQNTYSFGLGMELRKIKFGHVLCQMFRLSFKQKHEWGTKPTGTYAQDCTGLHKHTQDGNCFLHDCLNLRDAITHTS